VTTLTGHSRKTAAAAAFALLAVACGASGGAAAGGAPSPSARASSPAPAPSTASTGVICHDLAALRVSLAPLSPEQIKADPGMVAAGLTGVQSALATLARDVQGQWQSQIGALKSSLTQLKGQVKKLTADPGSHQAAAVRAAIAGVTATVRQLLNTLGAGCPSAGSSQSPG
jgi:hypothetical protein